LSEVITPAPHLQNRIHDLLIGIKPILEFSLNKPKIVPPEKQIALKCDSVNKH